MNNVFSNQSLRKAHAPMLHKVISSGLLLGLVVALGLGSTACQSKSDGGSNSGNSSSTSQMPKIQQKLVGHWKAEPTAEVKEAPELLFTEDGKVYFLFESSGQKGAFEYRYTVNSDAKPMQMDLTASGDGKDTLMAIFELPNDKELRLDGANVGAPRPTALTNKALVFKKVSDQATLPADTKVINTGFGNQANKAKESEGKTYLGSMNRSQQAHFLEKNKFASTIDELLLGIKSETDNYSFKIETPTAEQVVMTATAKKPELKSFTGVVIVEKAGTPDATTAAVICATDKGSTAPPTIAGAVKSVAEFQCPAGSTKL